jgi:hypothetical protein
MALEEIVDRLQGEMYVLRRQLAAEAQRLRDEVARAERAQRRDLVPVKPRAVISLRPVAKERED